LVSQNLEQFKFYENSVMDSNNKNVPGNYLGIPNIKGHPSCYNKGAVLKIHV